MRKKWLAFLLITVLGLLMLWLTSKGLIDSAKVLNRKKLLSLQAYLGPRILKTAVQGEDNIFFIESSCAVSGPKKTTVSMKPRQACAVESAAYLNPKKKIYYIDTCLNLQNFSTASFATEEVVRQVLYYPNVYVFPVQLSSYLKASPLEEWIERGLLNSSKYPVAHASDVLRLVTLWRYGGLYLDLDMVVLRPLDGLGWDFAVAETSTLLGNSVLSFSAQGVGHQVVELCLRELADTYQGNNWDFNGPKLITRVMYRLCDFNPVKEMTAELCGGMNVKPAESFFPFPYQLWQTLFTEEVVDFVMSLVQREGTYSVHAWNKMSASTTVNIGSHQPYALLANRFCRRVYSTAGAKL